MQTSYGSWTATAAARRVGGPAAGTALACALTALALALPAAAAALTRPSAATGSARSLTYASAVLTGTVNPNGNSTSYYFQYGLTKGYGGQTAIAGAGAGTHTLSVSLPISGLQPLTVYHYRLVAVNAAGATIASDRTLLTTKVPLSLQILVSPNPVPYAGVVTVQGTLSGTGNGLRNVVLQANPFPFAGPFMQVGNIQVTLPTGAFSFVVASLLDSTQYRVTTTTVPVVLSPAVGETVVARVASHIAHTHRPHLARVYGTVAPAADGAQVGVLRITHGRGVLVAGTVLRHRDPNSSRFSLGVHVRRGVYRVLVRMPVGPQASSYGQPLVIH